MKTRLTPPGLVTGGRRRLAVGLMPLLLGLGLAVETVQAIPSAPTGGRIHGRAPTATGNLTIRLPGGTTPLTNNAQVNWSAKPSEFTLAPLTPGLTYTDADGDLPSGVGITLANPPGVTWTWKKGATPLTAAQLSQPFQSNFADGTVLTVSASAPVNVTSVSGLPNTGSQTFTTLTYNVVVKKPLPPKVMANVHAFAFDAGFPKNGFVGAYFDFMMNGISTSDNYNYTYTTNQPVWTTVSGVGKVSFTQMPTAAQKTATITITDKSGQEPPRTYTFTLERWFVNNGVVKSHAAVADAYCAGLVNGYATPGKDELTIIVPAGSVKRIARGPLVNEWGNMAWFGNGWLENRFYWASEWDGARRYIVALWTPGEIATAAPVLGSSNYVNAACSRSL